jgi:hypothetical protein
MATVSFEQDLEKIKAMNGKQLTLQLKWHHQQGRSNQSPNQEDHSCQTWEAQSQRKAGFTL